MHNRRMQESFPKGCLLTVKEFTEKRGLLYGTVCNGVRPGNDKLPMYFI